MGANRFTGYVFWCGMQAGWEAGLHAKSAEPESAVGTRYCVVTDASTDGESVDSLACSKHATSCVTKVMGKM